jgi:hypothetical protein
MHASRPDRRRHLRVARLILTLLAPLLIALPPLFWIVEATARASRTTLGRDQGIFQYVAWAIGQGAIDYRDIRDVNGPLTHWIHVALLSMGGADEHRFRVLDLTVTGVTFALVGACVPGIGSPGGRPTAARGGPSVVARAAWALAGWVVLSGQYLLYGYWDLAQRESFFDWFLLPSIALQLVAQGGRCRCARRARAGRSRGRGGLMVLVGALSVVPWFGKPTYVLFTIVQLAVAALRDPREATARKTALLAFVLGGAVAAATQIAFLVARGDALAYARIQLVDVPAMYRFIWPRAPADLFSDPWRATQAIFALTGAVVFLALMALGEMPRRAAVVALAPVCALTGVVAQAKGFPYHFHPVTAAVHLQWLVLAAWVAERSRVAGRRLALARLARLAPVGVGTALALRIATDMEDSPYMRASWLLWGAATPAQRATRAYFAHFPEPDFFPFELRQTADYLRRHTGPAERVQTYGMDPYVLFLAGRLSATPYIYAYDLDADAALAGGTGGHPDDAQAARIRSMRDDHERDLLARLEASPPAAFVFIDGSPLISTVDAWNDFDAHCARSAAWVRSRYRETARFGHDHVWLRGDLPASRARDPGPAPDDVEPGDAGAAEADEGPSEEQPTPVAP